MRSTMRKLSKTQKAKNKALYKAIRKIWEKTDRSMDYKTFKKITLGLSAGKGTNPRAEAKLYAHSQRFVSPETVGKENLLTGLKKEFPDVYKELRRKMGRFDKGETMMSRLEWDSNQQMYKFTNEKGDTFWVDISNSPKQAYII